MERKREFLYPRLEVQLCFMRWDYKMLAEKTGINYTSLRRKLRGITPLHLSEAIRIRDVIQTEYGDETRVSLDKLFADQLSTGPYT